METSGGCKSIAYWSLLFIKHIYQLYSSYCYSIFSVLCGQMDNISSVPYNFQQSFSIFCQLAPSFVIVLCHITWLKHLVLASNNE
jgi:hypothetical protein